MAQNILNIKTSIKINDKFVVKLKNDKSLNKAEKNSCKVIEFSSEWNFEDLLTKIDEIDAINYSYLFIFSIVVNNFELCEPEIAKVQEKLLKFSKSRPLILQLTLNDEKLSKIFYKDEESEKFIDISHNKVKFVEITNFQSFLWMFLNNKLSILDEQIIRNKSQLILRFLRVLNLSDKFYERMVLEIAKNGTRGEFLAIIDAPFYECNEFLNENIEEYVKKIFVINPSIQKQDSSNINAETTSVLLTAVKNENADLIDYLVMNLTHFIQELSFDHQVKVSTAAFETQQFETLCDLVDIADFPFPGEFQSKAFEYEKLEDIIEERREFEAGIKNENFDEVKKYIDINSELKKVYNTSNNSALLVAKQSEKLRVFNFLILRGFKTTNPNEDLEDFKKEVIKFVNEQRKLNVEEGLLDDQRSINSLCNKSIIHNKKISKEMEKEYRRKIRSWYEDINKINNGPEFLNVAASCSRLGIIFDFENTTVENASLSGISALGVTYPLNKWIFIGAKLIDKEGKNRMQQIKGVLAHELCHYVMKLVYQNQESPFYKNRDDMKEKYEKMVKKIDKWSGKDSDCDAEDDKCNKIISSVFLGYDPEDFNAELIVRIVQILTEFADNKEVLTILQDEYKILFDFWYNDVIPDLENYLQRNEDVIKMNGTFDVLPGIIQSQYEISHQKNVEIEGIMKNKLSIVQTNVPKLLLINFHNYLKGKCGNLLDSQNIFVNPEKLQIQQHLADFNDVCNYNKNLRIIIDCSKGVPSNIKEFMQKNEHSCIFIVSNYSQTKVLKKKLKQDQTKNVICNYNWSDFTQKSQNLILKTKINFQNDSKITLEDLLMPGDLKKQEEATEAVLIDIEEPKEDLSKYFDDHLLNMLVENQQIMINTTEDENDFKLLYKPRNFIKKTVVPVNDQGFEIVFNWLLKCFKTVEEEKEEEIIQNQKITEGEFYENIKNNQYVLISDMPGNGKSWIMKHMAGELRKQNPLSWICYVDLKQFIDEFKAQQVELVFSTFMIEKILKLKYNFEAKIFEKLYNEGKVFILFDGFDEIAPDCAEFVSNLVQSLESDNGNQLWIATRNYFEVNLKKKLHLEEAYTLDEMTLDDGVDLIVKSWILKDQKSVPKSKKDFDKCIKESSKYENYNQKAQKIIENALVSRNNSIGLPQLFRMIVDGFKDAINIDDLQGAIIFEKFIDILFIRWSRY